jgi:20S proteasome alpha/beta subunit
VPIGAEQTASGYDVAWKVPGADQYTVWSTDNSGNYVSNVVGVVSGTSSALESLESTFHQDLNGDGTIGLATTVIEAFGSTSLVQGGSNYFFNPGPGTAGTELKYAGAPAVAGQFAGFVPIGAEQTASGYDVAWKVPGADQYTVWSTDNSGNYVSNVVGVVSGSSAALQSLETTFHQDLNGDGVIASLTARDPLASIAMSSEPAAPDTFSFRKDLAVRSMTADDLVEVKVFSDTHSTVLDHSQTAIDELHHLIAVAIDQPINSGSVHEQFLTDLISNLASSHFFGH